MFIWRQIKEIVKDKPFVLTNINYPAFEYHVLFTGRDTIVYSSFSNGYPLLEYVECIIYMDLDFTGIWVLQDHFESSERNSISHCKCECEWIAVLQSGCKCGAITPYHGKSLTGE